MRPISLNKAPAQQRQNVHDDVTRYSMWVMNVLKRLSDVRKRHSDVRKRHSDVRKRHSDRLGLVGKV